jgi:hypothetical protein
MNNKYSDVCNMGYYMGHMIVVSGGISDKVQFIIHIINQLQVGKLS